MVVSTDDEEIAAVAESCGAQAPFRRPPELSNDHAATIPVIAHAIRWWEENRAPVEFACCIYATAPMLRASDLRSTWGALTNSKDLDFVYAVDTAKQDIGWFYWGRAEAFTNRRPLAGDLQSVLHYCVGADRAIDINTEEDWQRCERMYQEIQERAIEARQE